MNTLQGPLVIHPFVSLDFKTRTSWLGYSPASIPCTCPNPVTLYTSQKQRLSPPCLSHSHLCFCTSCWFRRPLPSTFSPVSCLITYLILTPCHTMAVDFLKGGIRHLQPSILQQGYTLNIYCPEVQLSGLF